jgi:DNA-binding NarL/FixJ family response regulator
MFSIAADVSEIHAAFKHGASGYILKSIDPRDFASAVRQAVEKTAYHAIDLPAINAALAANTSGLSDRELQVLTAAARGLSNKAIAGEFSITEQTVKFHLTNIYRKLGISNRTEAGIWAVDEGLLGTMDSLPTAV